MKRKVIESFQYAADGVHPRLMRAGRSYEFPDDHAARFADEGKLQRLPNEAIVLMESGSGAEATPAIEIDEPAAVVRIVPARKPVRKRR
ncbi:hypothetical protein [Shinella pollutisoli]|uniref:Uncharacterized protein n=1 Tax=Shinella pollutisoli TaxID=2250594 RepID=A0ABV7D9W4_9HYPH|nr:hypothetical protein [Shinella pollutisoli]